MARRLAQASSRRVALLCGLLLLAAAATTHAQTHTSSSQRALQQQGSSSSDLFTCTNLVANLGTPANNKCCQLCWCIGNQSPQKMLASSGLQRYCTRQCSECVTSAAAECGAGAALPAVCANGLAYNSMVKSLVTKCVDIFASDPQGALGRAQGC